MDDLLAAPLDREDAGRVRAEGPPEGDIAEAVQGPGRLSLRRGGRGVHGGGTAERVPVGAFEFFNR